MDKIVVKRMAFSCSSAWKRLGAKLVDLSFSSCVLMATLVFLELVLVLLFQVDGGLLYIFEKMPLQMDRLISTFICCSVLIPMQHGIFKNSIGKKLFAIKVVNKHEKDLSFRESQSREIRIFFYGLFFLWLSLVYQYFAFKRNDILSWDKEMQLTVYYREYGVCSALIRGSVAISIYSSFMLLIGYLSIS